MLETPLPDARTALDSIRKNGDPFATTPLVPQPLKGVVFTHPRDGEKPATADPRIVKASGQFFTDNRRARRSLRIAGAGGVYTLAEVIQFLRGAYNRPRLVWGVSGFATLGFPCDISALEKLYEYLSIGHNVPSLMCDGAAAAGILGANGVLAAAHDIKTVGVTPFHGLSTMGPRTKIVVYGNTYDDRLTLVGLMPDILAVDGGGKGAQYEVVAALSGGGNVLMLREPNESIVPWWSVPLIAEAKESGQLVVCPTIDSIPEFAEQLAERARETLNVYRPARLECIEGLFRAEKS